MGSKKELQAAIAVLGLCMLVFGCTKTAESENSKKQVKIGVAVYNEEDVYVSKICGYLEDEIFQYEKDHPGVEIRKKIADARGSQRIVFHFEIFKFLYNRKLIRCTDNLSHIGNSF